MGTGRGGAGVWLSRTVLLDEFLHVHSYLYITYSLYFWQGWITSFYLTPGIFQKLQEDARPWPPSWAGQVRHTFRESSGHADRGQTGLQIASHSEEPCLQISLPELEAVPARWGVGGWWRGETTLAKPQNINRAHGQISLYIQYICMYNIYVLHICVLYICTTYILWYIVILVYSCIMWHIK